jgi:hypothetical protein
MASIIISGETMEDVPEVKKMVDELLKGKISMSRFIKFLDDNNLETKVRCVKENTNPSILADFIGDTLSTIFSVPEKSEHEDTEENDDEGVEDDENEETVENECKIPDELWKKTNEAYEKHVKATVDFAKRLIDDYGDSEEDDIDHTKAVKLYHSLMLLARTYHQRAFNGDERYNIPNFVPENILKFIESLDLPTDKIKAASERGKSTYYKMKNYKSFEEFEENMKDAYGIEDVWTPPKEIPDWFEAVRDNTYRKFHNDGHLESVYEDEWNEFKEWKEKKDKVDAKESFENQCKTIVNTIIDEFSPILTGKALKYFEKMYKSYNNTFMKQLKSLYSAVKSAKEDGLICFIDVKNSTIICNPIPNTKKDIEENILDALSEPKSKESSDKKSSSSKKTTSSASAKNDKTSAKKTAAKSSKTDTETKIKEFKKYADYILSNSITEDDARDMLLSYAANMDEKCKKLYECLIELKKNNDTVNLIKYIDGKTGKEDIGFE